MGERGYMIKALNLGDVGLKCSENTRHREMGLKNIFKDYNAWPEVFLFVPLAAPLNLLIKQPNPSAFRIKAFGHT